MATTPTPRAMANTLSLLANHPYILASWQHPAMLLHQQRGHATGTSVYQASGRLAKSKVWTITDAGRDWFHGR